jgi:hypothetical protein
MADFGNAPPMPSAPAPSGAPAMLMEWEKAWESSQDSILKSETFPEISVTDPEVLGTNVMNRFVAYTVKTDPYMYSVHRRYTDFLWLREQLVASYPGLLLPALPPKKSTTGVHRDVQGEFIRARMSHLNLFMGTLAKIPFLFADPAIDAFITRPNGPEWESAKNAISAGVDVSLSTGCSEWRRILDDCTAPEDDLTVERIVIEVRTHLQVLLSNLEQLDAEWTKTSSNGEKLQKDMDILAGSTDQWRDYELSVADEEAQNVISTLGPLMASCSTAASSIVSLWNDSSLRLSQNLNQEFLSTIQVQQMLAEGMADLLDNRETILKSIDQTERELATLRQDHERLRRKEQSIMDKMSGKTVSKVESSIARRESKLEELNSTLSRMGRALWFSEVDRFGKERALRLKESVFAIVEANTKHAAENHRNWQRIGKEIGMK